MPLAHQRAHTAHRTQVINIYVNQTSGQQTCTCCRFCEGWRFVPGAQIFAQCSVGSGTTSQVRFKSKLSHQKRGVARGKLVHYHASVKNLDKSAVLTGLALTVELPPLSNATLSSSKSSKGYAVAGTNFKTGKAQFRTTKGLTPMIVNSTTATLPTVTWTDLVLPPRKRMTFSISVRVNTLGNPAGTLLVFRGAVFQQLPVNGMPYCPSPSVNQTVSVRAK